MTSEAARDHVSLVPVGQARRLRASDADRAATVGALQDAVARGQLSYDEGDDRIADAFAARHLDQLPALTADLPVPAPAGPAAPGWRLLATGLLEQLRTEIRATRAAGIRSRRFAVAVLLLVLLLSGIVVFGVLAAHGVGDGEGFHGGFHEGFRGGFDDGL